MFDAPTQAALASGAVVLRDYFVAHGKTLGGVAKVFAYWTGEDNVAANLRTPGSDVLVNYSFVGGATLLDVPAIVDAIGLEARSTSLAFDHTSKVVGSPMDMVYGNNVRVARVEIHRGVFDAATWQLASTPHLIFAGRVDGASVDDAVPESEGGLKIDVVPSVIDLTRTNPAMKSDEQQRLRSGDRFGRYGDTAGQVETWWGVAKP